MIFTKKIISKDSQGNPIHIYLYEPQEKPVGVVMIIHGASEHFARYGLFSEYLNKSGFVVAGCDILGHGLSTDTTAYVHFSDKNGDSQAFESVLLVKDLITEKYPDLPKYVFGHSMGSFLARKLCIDYPDYFQKAVWTGTGFVSKSTIIMGKVIGKLLIMFHGPRYVSKFINGIAIDAYPKKMRERGIISGIDEEWLTKDKAIQDYYHNSPICGQPFTLGANLAMAKWADYVNKPVNIAKMNHDLPIFIGSGQNCPLGDFGKGVTRLYELMKKQGFKNVELNIYPDDRHEILNELDRDKVYKDIIDFLKK
ncbi:MAG TPA: alpha/beta hydrolase [Bacillota bacterium]|nr:alpha/beta hydrolase [Bacillota bacterium]HPF42159.1 alpha/beta hydrolase [Bacillota bacterium]